MAVVVPFGPWAPDVASVDAAASSIATNVFAYANGYGPVRAPKAITQALPGVCRGGIAVRTKTGAWVAYAGTVNGLYRYDPTTLGWTNVSNLTTTYTLPPEQYWSFALYGSLLIAVMTGVTPQEINIETGTNFIDMPHPGSDAPPAARFVSVVGEFVVLFGLPDTPNRVQWSGIANPHFWTPGANDADLQDLPDGGDVTGLAGGEYGIIFQERAIRRMTFAPGSQEIFQFDRVEDDRGAIAPWSVIKIGARIFFLDREGFYGWAGGQSAPIGSARVDRWYQANRDPTYAHTAVALADPTGPRVLWAFKSQGASDQTVLDQCIAYDWVQDKWTRLDLQIRYWLRAATAPISLDAISEDIDGGTSPYNFRDGLSLDGALFAGGTPQIGIFGLDNRLSLLEGPNLEALLETSEAQLARPGRAFVRGVRVDTDATDWRATVSTRESLGQDAAFRSRLETGPNRERYAPCRASGRYHKALIRIPAGTAWTYAQGIEPDAVAEGLQ